MVSECQGSVLRCEAGQDNGGEPVLHYVLEYAPDGLWANDCAFFVIRSLCSAVLKGATLQHLAGAQGAEREKEFFWALSSLAGRWALPGQHAVDSSKSSLLAEFGGDVTATLRFTKTIFNLGQGLVSGGSVRLSPATGEDAAAQVSVPDPRRDQCRRQGSVLALQRLAEASS